ncbi:MAG: asparagine synthase (glutamine-hydrolyzing) [Spirochaetales bacterium]|nr:asparagine synthase (glutamine-hydrolyzing) [Spirochaetales bacterium]
MCGICGIVTSETGERPSLPTLKAMMAQLKHRGPDACGYFIDNQAGLGHTRLSIIDLSGGGQPLCNEDKNLWISFNGEIFNYLELAKELKASGHIFQTKSDTEVIVHAYEEWGTDCFKRFNGQWAIAIWNRKTKELVLSRDRFGIRPLYYSEIKGALIFASEIKSIFAHPKASRMFDPAGLNEIFTFWCPVAPRTPYLGVKQLPPGSFAKFSGSILKHQAYWQLDFPEKPQSKYNFQENVEAFREHLIKAAQLRFTRSDVPVGAYLSGGIDSSVTTAVLSQYTNSPLKTFSIRFKDQEFDEGNFQKTMVDRLGSDHQDLVVSEEDIGSAFPEVIKHTEHPILRTAPAPLFLLSGLVRKAGYKVVVTGEGSDEIVAGYDIFREARVRHFIARNPDSSKRAGIVEALYPWMKRSPGSAPAFARAFFSKSLDPTDSYLSHRTRWDTTTSLKAMLNPELKSNVEKMDALSTLREIQPPRFSHWDQLEQAQWLETKTLLSGYILASQGDRMLMGHSVEGRFPFLDCNFAEFVATLPPEHKLMGLNEKYILKMAFKDMVPHDILFRDKQPYRAPDAASFFWGGTSQDWIEEITRPEFVENTAIFNPKAVELLMTKCRKIDGSKMSNSDNMRVVAVMSTLLCQKKIIEADYQFKEDDLPPLTNTIDFTK